MQTSVLDQALEKTVVSDNKLTADRFLMVTPAHLDACQCPDNVFTDLVHGVDHVKALEEHAAVVERLRSLGKEVQVFEGRSSDDTFCNNIYGTNHKKELIIGNMFYPARQMEGERTDIRAWFYKQGYKEVEMAHHTEDPAELTGVLVMDHQRNLGLCGLSNRVTEESAQVFEKVFGLNEVWAFPITIYHTNVGLSILASRAALFCPKMFANPADADRLREMYPQHIEISEYQMANFAGNALAVSDQDVMMSLRGYESLNAEQLSQFDEYGFQIQAVDLSEIEKSGGSMRCLLAEVF
jgi:hypothetical protein